MKCINNNAGRTFGMRGLRALGTAVVLAAAFGPGAAKADDHQHVHTTFNFVVASAASNVFMIATTTRDEDNKKTQKVVAQIPTEGPHQSVTTADGKITYSVDSKKNVVVFSDGDRDDPDQIQVAEGPTGLALSLDGTKLYVFSAIAKKISVIDTKKEAVVEVDPAPAYNFGINVTPGGNLVAVD